MSSVITGGYRAFVQYTPSLYRSEESGAFGPMAVGIGEDCLMNRRAKGSEKFWSDPGAEAILQLRADRLRESENMSRFGLAREAGARSGRPDRPAS